MHKPSPAARLKGRAFSFNPVVLSGGFAGLDIPQKA